MAKKIREFLIATTLKDCSVMVTFQRISPPPPGQQLPGELFDELSQAWYQACG
jgi:hypothetical protein